MCKWQMRAYALVPRPSIASYLVSEKIVQAAKAAGAEAVHPGYGFLSEDDEFAQQLQQAGMIFVGPTPASDSHHGGQKSC